MARGSEGLKVRSRFRVGVGELLRREEEAVGVLRQTPVVCGGADVVHHSLLLQPRNEWQK